PFRGAEVAPPREAWDALIVGAVAEQAVVDGRGGVAAILIGIGHDRVGETALIGRVVVHGGHGFRNPYAHIGVVVRVVVVPHGVGDEREAHVGPVVGIGAGAGDAHDAAEVAAVVGAHIERGGIRNHD